MPRRLRNNVLISGCDARIHLVQHLPQLVAKVVHVLETIFRCFCKCLVDDLLETWWNWGRAQLRNWSGRIVQHSVRYGDCRLTAKRQWAGQLFVYQHARRENIRTLIDAIATRLFRRCIRCSAVRYPYFGEFGAMNSSGCRFRIVEQLSQPEVEHFHLARRSHHYISRLDVATNDAAAVRGGESVGDL